MENMRNKVAVGVASALSSSSQLSEKQGMKKLQSELVRTRMEISNIQRALSAEKRKNDEQAETIREAKEIIVDLQKDLARAEKGENNLKNLLQQEKARRIARFMSSSSQSETERTGDENEAKATDTLEDAEPTADIIPESNLQSNSTVETIESMRPVSGPTGDGDDDDQGDENEDTASINVEHAQDISKSNIGFYCICGKDFSNKWKLQCHIRYYTCHNFQCDICEKQFPYLCYLKRHKMVKHKVSCDDGTDCGQVFPGTADLCLHRELEHTTVEYGDAQPPLESENFNDGDHQNQMVSASAEDNMQLLTAATPNESSSIAKTADNAAGTETVKHALDVSKRADGIFCRCGKCFTSRKTLDSHLSKNSLKSVGDRKDDDDFQLEDEMESSESSWENNVKANKRVRPKKNRKRKRDLRKTGNGTKLKRGRRKGTKLGNSKSHIVDDVPSKTGSSTCGIGFQAIAEHVVCHGHDNGTNFGRPDVSDENHESASMDMDALIKLELVADSGESSAVQHPQRVPIYEDAHENQAMQVQENLDYSSKEAHGVDLSIEGDGYACICRNEYKSQEWLETHICLHTENLRYPCIICGYFFIFEGGLKMHMIRHHESNNVQTPPTGN